MDQPQGGTNESMNKPLIALALVTSVAATACTHTTKEIRHVRDRASSKRSPRGEAMLLRSYEVPEGSGPALRQTLVRVFAGSKERPAIAHAAVAPDGRLVVTGPAAIHEGVAELLGKMKSVAGAAPSSVAVTYWIVEARPASEGEVDPALAEIRAPLMRASGGKAVAFSPVERVTLRSTHDVRATHEGRSAEVRQTIRRADQRLLGDLEVQHHGEDGGELRTLVDLTPGAPVVVGEMEGRADAGGVRSRYLFVVRADEAPSS